MQSIDVHIHTNTNCNLKCRHCYVDANSCKTETINGEFLIKLITYLCDNFDTDIHLEGGEIFLEEHLICSLLKLSDPAKKTITITSNGLIRTEYEDTLEALRSVSCLRISVEGHTEYMHRKIRNCSLRTVLDNAAYYKKHGINVVLRMTLNAFNVGSIFSGVIPSLKKEGFDNFQLYEMQPVGRGNGSDLCIEGTLEFLYNDWVSHPTHVNTSISLPGRRIEEVKRYSSDLKRIGVRIERVGNAASISISPSREIKICPWDMTSAQGMIIDENNFETVVDIIKGQTVPHRCDFCSKIVLREGAQC